MKPAPFQLVRADSVAHAVELLAAHGDSAKVLAGGQSLLPIMGLRLAAPKVLVDVSRTEELRGDDVVDDAVVLRAATTHSDIEDGRVHDPTGGWLRSVARGIGYRAIRNRGTIAGSLAHADGSAEWPVVMSALDAEVVARSTRGARSIPCDGFFEGFFTTSLADDEVITAVRIPTPERDAQFGFVKSTRKVGEFAESICFIVRGRARVAAWLGGSGVPRRLPQVESLIREGVDSASNRDRDRIHTAVQADLGLASGQVAEYDNYLHSETVWRALSAASTVPTEYRGVPRA